MTQRGAGETSVARLQDVSLRYGKAVALDAVSLDIPAGAMVGLIGPDGVGKSSLLALVAGARRLQSGSIEVLGGDIADPRFRASVCRRIAFMPQGLGKNLYPTLSVFENIDFFGGLFGHARRERKRRIAELLKATGLAPFADRSVGKLSGGMRQKLGLCCALIHDPDLLILDEPTTGVDPLSRQHFWELIERIRTNRPDTSVLVATAYMEEAAHFDWLVAMNDGQVLATGQPETVLEQTDSRSLEAAFISLLPKAQQADYRPVEIRPRAAEGGGEIAIEARDLTKRFGDFTAVDHVDLRVERGEIFGFFGSNGCGKTTTMKMLTGLLPASDGATRLFGKPLDPHDLDTRRRVGYMTQLFSLYGELTVQQNLVLHARLFGVPRERVAGRVEEMADRFVLGRIMHALPEALTLGDRQRLSLAVAMIHRPEMLILDEPTSGVDPIAREAFWRILIDLAREDEVTVFVSSHFINEAERCDRIALMHAGEVLVSDSPSGITEQRGAASLEEAFIEYLEEAASAEAQAMPEENASVVEAEPEAASSREARQGRGFSLRRFMSCSHRESLELRRDPIRLALATFGSVLLMVALGYGISMDVEDLKFAVLDRDRTALSRDYAWNLSGSRYFLEQSPIETYEELDRRMRADEISLAIEIPPGFSRDLARGQTVEIGAWIDGAMPTRAETIRGYVQGMHRHWLTLQTREAHGDEALARPAEVETRYRYNPEVKSLPAFVPAMIPLLLMLIPAILGALSVVREKELGSIVNLYVTPVTRLEFLLGKQVPYIVLSMASFLLLVALALFVFRVPITGSFPALVLAALLYVTSAIAIGLVISTFVHSQVAALFGTALLTILPTVQFSGLINPVTSLEGPGAWVGQVFPATHFITISRGTFSKGLGFADLQASFVPLIIAVPVLIGLGALLLKKQER